MAQIAKARYAMDYPTVSNRFAVQCAVHRMADRDEVVRMRSTDGDLPEFQRNTRRRPNYIAPCQASVIWEPCRYGVAVYFSSNVSLNDGMPPAEDQAFVDENGWRSWKQRGRSMEAGEWVVTDRTSTAHDLLCGSGRCADAPRRCETKRPRS